MIQWTLFYTFFKIGLFTFGGGYAMLPLIQSEVLAHGWMPLESIVNFIAISESTPGVFAVNIATYSGMETGGFFGAVCATLGVIMPSFLIILLVARGYEKFRKSFFVQGIMTGLRPAVVGLIASSVLSVGAAVFFHSGWDVSVFATPSFWFSLVIFVVAAILAFRKKHPILLLCLCAAAGLIVGSVFDLAV